MTPEITPSLSSYYKGSIRLDLNTTNNNNDGDNSTHRRICYKGSIYLAILQEQGHRQVAPTISTDVNIQ